MSGILKGYLIFTIIFSLIAFVICGYDKWMAKKGGWRVSELRLILMGLFGGGIGLSAGIYLFRHKTKHPLVYVPCLYGAGVSVVLGGLIWWLNF